MRRQVSVVYDWAAPRDVSAVVLDAAAAAADDDDDDVDGYSGLM